VRSLALDALKAAGISWTEVFVGGGVATIGVVDVGAKLDLPPLPARDVVLHSNVNDRGTQKFSEDACGDHQGEGEVDKSRLTCLKEAKLFLIMDFHSTI
jgi:hypothetical protein